ncbi:arginyl-tRNA synthetase [Thraustotheca clavata]|uniref:arginine--tRNA ligase n=1 Tax=Thraustotheca clavata TaxID=74557 RepID=A0A1W0A7B8_9STRA|nr:arginyl-tRNA synthetase [Thraustotheca clavata]
MELIVGTFNERVLKCMVALKETGASFELRKAPTPSTTPKLAVGELTLNTANSICRYVASNAGKLAFDDLAVDDFVEWEERTLRVALAGSDKAALSSVIEGKIRATSFLVGNAMTLADVVVAPVLRVALNGLPADKFALTNARAYVANFFAIPVVAAADSFVENKGLAPRTTQPLSKDTAAGKTFDHLQGIIENLFDEAIHKAFPGVLAQYNIALDVARTRTQKFGDYQCNNAMNIFTALKGTSGAPSSPRDVATAILAAMPENNVIENLSVAGPGFINAFLKKEFIGTRLETLLQKGVHAAPSKKMKIVIDFSSPNIAKDMHVGHLRSTIIGDAMCRILEFQGHEVMRINHVGDWGTQFGMLICHLMDVFPNWQEVMPDITDLTQLYKNAKQRFDEDEAFHKRSKDQVVLLQSGDEQSRKVWNTLCDISRKEFQKVYDRLGVSLYEMGESFYNPIIPKVIKMLEDQKITEDSNGAKVIFTSKYKQPFMLVKSDGSYLYDTTDIAALWYRLNEMKADWIIIYTDYTQQDHFGLLFEVGKMSKILDPSKHRVNHIGFGTVNDESGKRFKTRSGETVRLVDLLDEAKARMKEQLTSRIASGQTSLPASEVDAAAERIGYGAVKYFDLSQSPTTSYEFSYDKMLSTTGNTAVYLLFAYARLSSIIRKSGVDMKTLDTKVLKLADPHEVALAVELLQFQDIICFINKDLASNRLCAYLYNIAEKVQLFVTKCRVIGVPEQNSRLLLCQATLKVMQTCFQMLGIDPLDQI